MCINPYQGVACKRRYTVGTMQATWCKGLPPAQPIHKTTYQVINGVVSQCTCLLTSYLRFDTSKQWQCSTCWAFLHVATLLPLRTMPRPLPNATMFSVSNCAIITIANGLILRCKMWMLMHGTSCNATMLYVAERTNKTTISHLDLVCNHGYLQLASPYECWEIISPQQLETS